MENTEEFEPYKTYPLSAALIARQLNEPVRMFPWLEMAHPIDGDALNREAAAELGMTLRSIVEGAAGPKLTGTVRLEVIAVVPKRHV